MTTNHTDVAIDELDCLVVGSGFGGCYLLHLLRDKLGLNVSMVDAGSFFGGVWNWSRYPGARVDSEMPWYGFSDPAIWKSWQWTERYSDFMELQRYFDHVARVWDLRRSTAFNTQVVEAIWSEKHARWLVTTKDGRRIRCRWFLPATGTSFKQYIPDFEGMSNFKGTIHHSSLWPERGVNMRDKRVAVIGAGSSGIQIVQEAAKVASHLTQFIRTPNLALPMGQRSISAKEVEDLKPRMAETFKYCRNTASGLPLIGTTKKTFDLSEDERRAYWESTWADGGFQWRLRGFPDTVVDPKANALAYDFWAEKMGPRVKDPAKRNIVVPKKAPYYLGTKRPSLEQDYYEMIDQPQVSLATSPIREFTEDGIVTEDGEHHRFDIVAIATGYDAITGGLRTMGIKGRGGTDLDERWANGVRTTLGMLVHGFPNMMMCYGPQAPTSFTNGPPFIELQCEWMADVIKRQLTEGLATVESKVDADEAWRKKCLDIADTTLMVQTSSWYMGANVPGKRRELLLYLGGIPSYKEACEEAIRDWKSFDVKRSSAQARI